VKKINQANQFFSAKIIGDRIWAIDGLLNDLMYLVEGSEKAMLVDTGMGIGDLASQVRQLTRLPLLVVNTHGHPDHAGGNPNFDEVWFPEKDLTIMQNMCTDEYRLRDLKAFHGDNPSQYQQLLSGMVSYKPVKLHFFSQNQVIDLGQRIFEVVEIPGHTPGSIGLINPGEKLFFIGDSIVQTPVWLYLKQSLPFAVYRQSLKAIKKREDEFEKMFPGHNPTPLRKDLLDDLLYCTNEIWDQRGIGQLTKTFAGEGYLWHYGKASIIYDPDNWL
jgi:hydroxyacylglutathione hydrolase